MKLIALLVLTSSLLVAPAAAVPVTFQVPDNRDLFRFLTSDPSIFTIEGETVEFGFVGLGRRLLVSTGIGPFPQPTESVLFRATAYLNGVLIAHQESLEPPAIAAIGEPFTHLGLSFDIRLPEACCFYTPHQLVIDLTLPDDHVSFQGSVLEPTPEPATLLLPGTALAGLGWRARRTARS